jgi:hypothetical protein
MLRSTLSGCGGSRPPIGAPGAMPHRARTMTLKAMLVWTLLAAFAPVAANAKCGTGNALSYGDIDAVMFTQNGCKSTIQDADVSALRSPARPRRWYVSAFDCSTFWVLFWNNGREDVTTTYSQYNLKNAVGMFDLSATLDDARTLLDRDQFYDLNPDSLMITDTARAVLSVKRCGVITRIRSYNLPGSALGQDAPTVKLFDDFRALIAGASRERISSVPKDFELTGLFDP